MITAQNYHYIHRISKRTIPLLKQENRFTKVYKRKGKSDEANTRITELIQSGKPFMVARYGSTESAAIVNYLELQKKQNDLKAIYRHLKGDLNIYWKKHPKFLDNLCSLSGFFPKDENLLKNFIEIMVDASKNLDILGIWNNLEEYIPNIPEEILLCRIRELEPWFYENPWSYHLKNKKVLVIHPFRDSIEAQYAKKQRGGNYIKIRIFCPLLN